MYDNSKLHIYIRKNNIENIKLTTYYNYIENEWVKHKLANYFNGQVGSVVKLKVLNWR